MTSIPRTRLNRLMDLAPRRFHISSDPPFGGGLVIFAHENEDFGEDGLEMFMLEKETIRNCKPGIWASRSRELDPEQVHEDAGDCDREALLFWVAEGTIDISQSVKEWTKYDEESRRVDEAVKVENIVPKGTKWRRYGTHFDDGGVCCVISAEYLTHDAARIIQFGSKDSEEELDFGTYLEALCTCGIAMSADPQEGRFTLGGMNFWQDEVGGPPRIAVAENEEGQVIAVRFYCGMEDWTSGGSTDGLSSDEEEERDEVSEEEEDKAGR